MNKSISNGACLRLITTLQSSQPSFETESYSPYPWTDEEMIARYEMRYATPKELRIFPVHRLVIKVVKAKIIKIARSPYFNPRAGIGWIV